jgi:hypothetical protein
VSWCSGTGAEERWTHMGYLLFFCSVVYFSLMLYFESKFPIGKLVLGILDAFVLWDCFDC